MPPGAPPPPRLSFKSLSDSDSEAHSESANRLPRPGGPGPCPQAAKPPGPRILRRLSRLSRFPGLAIECPLHSQAIWQGNL